MADIEFTNDFTTIEAADSEETGRTTGEKIKGRLVIDG
jgi:hypothetical protein